MGLLLAPLAACDSASLPANAAGAAAPLVEGRVFPSSMLDLISTRSDGGRSWHGKMLILNVWATWCPPCRREMPDLERLSQRLDPKRFAVIGISVDADTLLVSEFLLQNGITFANYFDQNAQVSRVVGLKAYPETFVIAPNRTLVKRMTGYREWNSPEMLGMLKALEQSQQHTSQSLELR